MAAEFFSEPSAFHPCYLDKARTIRTDFFFLVGRTRGYNERCLLWRPRSCAAYGIAAHGAVRCTEQQWRWDDCHEANGVQQCIRIVLCFLCFPQ